MPVSDIPNTPEVIKRRQEIDRAIRGRGDVASRDINKAVEEQLRYEYLGALPEEESNEPVTDAEDEEVGDPNALPEE